MCGGLIRSSSGTLIKGFSCNLGLCNSVWAELWALRLGIKLARSLAIPSSVFELDSKVVVNMVRMRGAHNKFLQPFLHEVLELLDDPSWRTYVIHVFREANRCADYLANEGHNIPLGWQVFDRASLTLALILREDALGCSIPRLIS